MNDSAHEGSGAAEDPKRRQFRVRSPGARMEFDFMQRTLYDASTIIFGATVLLILASMLIGGARTWSVMAVDGLCLAGGIAGRIAHTKRRPRSGWWLLSGFLVAAITWNVVFHGGIDAPAIVQYVVLVAVVMRILGARAAAITAPVCVAALGAAAWAQTVGLLPQSSLTDLTWRHALTAAITVALLGVLMWHASRQDSLQHAARERVEDFARASGGWFWEADARGRLFWVSEGAAAALRGPAASFTGKTLLELDDRGSDASSATARSFSETIKRGEPIRALRLLRRDADGPHWYEVSGVPNFAADGRLAGYRGVVLNASDRGTAGTNDAGESGKSAPSAG